MPGPAETKLVEKNRSWSVDANVRAATLGEKTRQLYGLAEGEIPAVASPKGKFGTPGYPTAGKIWTTYQENFAHRSDIRRFIRGLRWRITDAQQTWTVKCHVEHLREVASPGVSDKNDSTDYSGEISVLTARLFIPLVWVRKHCFCTWFCSWTMKWFGSPVDEDPSIHWKLLNKKQNCATQQMFTLKRQSQGFMWPRRWYPRLIMKFQNDYLEGTKIKTPTKEWRVHIVVAAAKIWRFNWFRIEYQ